MSNYKICSRCILDETVPGIEFDDNGECNYCKLHDRFEKLYPLDAEGQLVLNSKIQLIKQHGKNKKYDCILGLSGGRDSCYMLDWAVKSGLRPLAVFYDSGWYSEQSKENISKVAGKLGVDVEIVKCELNEYYDIQRAFLFGSTNDIDAPDDQAIIAVLIKSAIKYRIKYILSGHSFRTEGNTPITWSYMDGRYVKDVHSRYGRINTLTTYPILGFRQLLTAVIIRRIKYIYPLEYVDYKKDSVNDYLAQEYNWVYAGGHHFDCQYIHLITKILREKFRIDKRKVEFSALVRSGQMSRDQALMAIKNDPAPEDDELVRYSLDRIGISSQDFIEIMNLPPKKFLDYKTYFGLISRFGFFIGFVCKLGVLPMSFYEKYVKLAKNIKIS